MNDVKDHNIIAVDFDGTLCKACWPNIGEPNNDVIEYLKSRKRHGARLILWTCRYGQELDDAVLWCAEHGLYFDRVNENLPETLKWMNPESRKIFANEYLDDRGQLGWLEFESYYKTTEGASLRLADTVEDLFKGIKERFKNVFGGKDERR